MPFKANMASLACLPISSQECRVLGWEFVDIVLVTGDAYIDHPSFGVALIGRLLQSHGYRVAILSQPHYHHVEDFRQFGPPLLFFGITAGNLDSIVANYSGNGKVRASDAYSPNGNPWFDKEQTKMNRRRPDRASLLYANLARAAFKDVPVVLGGIEASLRRFIHYDYKQERLRGSVLTDAKADLLIYGMGEKSVIEIAQRIAENRPLEQIAGTCRRLTDRELTLHFPDMSCPDNGRKLRILPSWEDIQRDRGLFMEAERIIDLQARSCSQEILAQRQQSSWLIQYPASPPLTTRELDELYELPFSRKPHPSTPDIPAYTMIRHSITIVRGCSGNCSFCAISRHQGPVISSRSKDSILLEAARVRDMDDFDGTITDLGGPTANLYKTNCSLKACKKHDCLFPMVCRHLRLDENALIDVLQSVRAINGIHHVFISSGLRMELLLKTPRLLEALILSHLPGSIKIAPEHTEDEILTLMHKESHRKLCEFLDRCSKIAKKLGKEIHFNPYIITAHPGCTEQHSVMMAKKLRKLGLYVRQFQDFTPTPGTLSTAIYVTGLHPDTNTPLFIPRNQSDKRQQRKILEGNLPPKPGKKKTQSGKR
jgi:uncharacterized radical SAM protein YgiQ